MNIVLSMSSNDFFDQLEAYIVEYDLLCHPFYQAWSAGELTRGDLREYAASYYHHVRAFPTYLSMFADRLPDGQLRSTVIANMMDELGRGPDGISHADL